jgi:hypothetical protein
VSAVHPPVSAMKIHHQVQRKNAEIVSCYAKPSNKKSGTRIFPKTTNQKEIRDWHHIKVVWSINLERRASEYKDSVCTKCLNTFRKTKIIKKVGVNSLDLPSSESRKGPLQGTQCINANLLQPCPTGILESLLMFLLLAPLYNKVSNLPTENVKIKPLSPQHLVSLFGDS